MIEMLVVVAIVAILPTIIVANFPQIRLQFALSRATYSFAQDTRRAQGMSISSNLYKDSNGNVQPVSGYGVYVNMDNGNKKYIIYADVYPGNRQYDELIDYVVQTIDIAASEPGVIIKQLDNIFGNIVSINFNPPDPTTTIAQLFEQEHVLDVIFALESDPSITKTVSINTSGLIEVK